MKTTGYFKAGQALAILLAFAIALAAPLAIVWALNTLFPVLAIPYTIWTWLAVIVLGGFWKAKVKLDK
jgi:hypothetical protein